MVEINFSELPLEEIKGDINLFLWNNGYPVETMKATNDLIARLKNAKIILN